MPNIVLNNEPNTKITIRFTARVMHCKFYTGAYIEESTTNGATDQIRISQNKSHMDDIYDRTNNTASTCKITTIRSELSGIENFAFDTIHNPLKVVLCKTIKVHRLKHRNKCKSGEANKSLRSQHHKDRDIVKLIASDILTSQPITMTTGCKPKAIIFVGNYTSLQLE